MGKKEAVPNRRHTEEFKAEAVRLALSTGGNAAAKRPGIPQSTMTNRVRQSREGTSAPATGAAAVKRPVSERSHNRDRSPVRDAGPVRARPPSLRTRGHLGARAGLSRQACGRPVAAANRRLTRPSGSSTLGLVRLK